MTISITNTRFKGHRFISVPAGSSLPDMVILGSSIAAKDAIFEERDSHQSDAAAPDHHGEIDRFQPRGGHPVIYRDNTCARCAAQFLFAWSIDMVAGACLG